MIVTLAGIGGHYPPSDDEGFTAQLAELRSPIIAQEVAIAEPMSQVYSYRQMADRWRHYDKWEARLDGLGDSSCAFNPVYGQGMTSGALSALILGECLEKHGINDAGVPRKFFEAQARFQSEPWGLATGADFRNPGTEGKQSLVSRVTAPLFGKMFDVANDDSAIGERIGEVINMMKPPSALFEPPLLGMIARRGCGACSGESDRSRKRRRCRRWRWAPRLARAGWESDRLMRGSVRRFPSASLRAGSRPPRQGTAPSTALRTGSAPWEYCKRVGNRVRSASGNALRCRATKGTGPRA